MSKIRVELMKEAQIATKEEFMETLFSKYSYEDFVIIKNMERFYE